MYVMLRSGRRLIQYGIKSFWARRGNYSCRDILEKKKMHPIRKINIHVLEKFRKKMQLMDNPVKAVKVVLEQFKLAKQSYKM